MRAWNYSALAILVAACGGSETDIDGGDDSGVGNDVFTQPDVTTTPDTGVDDAPFVDVIDEPFVEAGPFTPTSFGSNLVLWLDAAKGVTLNTNVQTWADQSTYKNDGTGGTGGGAHQPTVTASAINGLPAITFSATSNPSQYIDLADPASLEWGTGDFAIFVVGAYTNLSTTNNAGEGTFYAKFAGNNGVFLYGNAINGSGPGYTSSCRLRLTATDNVNSTGTGYNDGKFHRIGGRRNGSTIEIWVDGTPTSFSPDAGGNPDVSAGGSSAQIGGENQGQGTGARLAGSIAEVIGVKGTTSPTDMTNLDGYFKSKYAL